MRQITTDVAVIGAGPAGLSAAYQAARAGAKVTLIDENKRPGGPRIIGGGGRVPIAIFFIKKHVREVSCLSRFTSFLGPKSTMPV